jgi:hypothetical protein
MKPNRLPTRGVIAGAMLLLAVATAAGCSHSITDSDIQPPPQQEFGFGPRTSAAGLYQATVHPMQPIRVGQLHGWRLEVQRVGGGAVTGATIVVDGGMPQHGHGLPTSPRVSRELGNGAYEVEGMKFNMGGWWVVTFRISTPAGADTVTFNLSL